MSSFEPPTTAKVVIHTSKGPISIELWAKETPITCRNFIKNCLENVYKDCTFDKIIPNFIVQVSSPSKTRDNFKTELHQRLKFNRRGLVGNCKLPNVKDSNNNQFFITTSGECDHLNGNTTLFGKITDNTIFNVLKISESELQEDGEPLYPTKITKCEVVIKYFDDLEVDKGKRPQVDEPLSKKQKKKKIKISFDDELEKDEIEVKVRSAHDVFDDKKLSKQSVIEVPKIEDAVPKIEEEEKEEEKKEEESVVEKMKKKYKQKQRSIDTMKVLDQFIKQPHHSWL